MNLNTNKLVSAVRFGLAIGAAATAGTTLAQNADSADSKARNLETIVVTGSNIRRVDMETANPVITIDHAAISKSGKTTLGLALLRLISSKVSRSWVPGSDRPEVGSAR